MMLAALLLTVQAPILEPPRIPIAVVNIPRVVAESVPGKAASAQVDALRKEREKSLSDKQAGIQALIQKQALRVDVDRAQRELQRLREDADADLGALNDRLQTEFTARLRPVLTQIANDDRIGLILELPHPELILWFSPAVDITSKVIQRLDAGEAPKPKE
jgi:Skp family chaperone for outer membrane proteins